MEFNKFPAFTATATTPVSAVTSPSLPISSSHQDILPSNYEYRGQNYHSFPSQNPPLGFLPTYVHSSMLPMLHRTPRGSIPSACIAPVRDMLPMNPIPVSQIGVLCPQLMGGLPTTNIAPDPLMFSVHPLPDELNVQHPLPLAGLVTEGFPTNQICDNSPRLLSAVDPFKQSDQSISKEARKKRTTALMARRMSSTTSAIKFLSSSSTFHTGRIPPTTTPINDNNKDLILEKHGGIEVKLLVKKVLQSSDISLRRIALPKQAVESYLPLLTENERIPMTLKEIDSTQTWSMRYRSCRNHGSRSYVFDRAGEYLKHHQLKRSDIVMIYGDDNGQLFIYSTKEGPSFDTPSENRADGVGTSSLHMDVAESPLIPVGMDMDMEGYFKELVKYLDLDDYDILDNEKKCCDNAVVPNYF